jgi:hypothetical protein
LKKSGINFHEFGLGHDFLDMTSEEQATKENMLDFMETKKKSFCDSSNTIKKIKMKTQNKRQHLQVIHVTGEMCIQFIRVPTI